jgi:hypothetical protein
VRQDCRFDHFVKVKLFSDISGFFTVFVPIPVLLLPGTRRETYHGVIRDVKPESSPESSRAANANERLDESLYKFHITH